MQDGAKIAMRTYLSAHHLFAAVHFARLGLELENRHTGQPKFSHEHRSYVIGSVLSAVAFLEAAINEVFCNAADGHNALKPLTQSAHDLMRELWGMGIPRTASYPILKKYQVALVLAGKPQLEDGRQPYQDAHLLIQLRNALVHYEPEWLPAPTGAHGFEVKLKHKFPPSALFAGSGNCWYPDHCLGYGCSRWAVNTSVALTEEFLSRMAISGNYQAILPKLGLPLPEKLGPPLP